VLAAALVPDGQQLAFFGHLPGEPWQIYVVPAQGGTPQLIYKSSSNLADPSWSPDGNSMAFGENSLNNQGSAAYILDLKTKNAAKLPGSDGLYSPRWSPDGRFIAAITLDSLHLKLFDLHSQKWAELATIFVAYPSWSRDSHYLYFVGILTTPKAIRVQVPTGKIERLFSLKGFRRQRCFRQLVGYCSRWHSLAGARRQHSKIYALDLVLVITREASADRMKIRPNTLWPEMHPTWTPHFCLAPTIRRESSNITTSSAPTTVRSGANTCITVTGFAVTNPRNKPSCS
jgi:hypothetical protein